MAKQYDSGVHNQQVEKAQEAVSFNDTFDSAPDVFVTSYNTTDPAKGTGASSITTTGFNIYSERTGDTGWIARETGFDEASSSSSSSSRSSSSSSSSSTFPWNCPIDYRVQKGTVLSTQTIPELCTNDGTSLCVAETSGAPGFNIEFDFDFVPDTTGVYHFEIIFSYNGSLGHRIKLQGWNYNTLAWENFDISLTDFPNTGGDLALALVNVGIGEEVNDFILDGTMLTRIYHITAGNTNHIFCVDQMILLEGFLTSSSSSSSSSSSTSSSSSSVSSSSSSVSSSSSSFSSSSSSSATPGTVVYGHHTAVDEDYDEDFTANWTTDDGWNISGSPGTDAETIDTTAFCGAASISDPWLLGAMTAVIRVDKYQTGSGPTPVIQYRTATTEAGITAASFVTYNGVSFVSLGWIQLRIVHT